MSASAKTSLSSLSKQANSRKSMSKETKMSNDDWSIPTTVPSSAETKSKTHTSLSKETNHSKDESIGPTEPSPVEEKLKQVKPKKVKQLDTFEFTTPPAMVVNEPSSIGMEETVKLDAPIKKVKKRVSKINFAPDTQDNEDVDDEEDEAKRAKMLLRSRRQSRGGGPEIRLEVEAAAEGQKEKLARITKHVAQKIQVNNLIRSMKTTELERYSKNPEHFAYLNRIGDETKREINASLQEQLMSETLQTLLITDDNYRKDLGGQHPVMGDIEERINYIEDVLETQEFNRVYEKQNFIQKIAEKARTSKLPSKRGGSQLSFFGNFTQDEPTTDGLGQFRRSYANTNTLIPSTFVLTMVAMVCVFVSAALVYHDPPK